MRAVAFVSFVRRTSLVGAFACLAFPALAADPKPDAAVKTERSSSTQSRCGAGFRSKGRKGSTKRGASGSAEISQFFIGWDSADTQSAPLVSDAFI